MEEPPTPAQFQESFRQTAGKSESQSLHWRGSHSCRNRPGSGPHVLSHCLRAAHGVTLGSETPLPCRRDPPSHPNCQHVTFSPQSTYHYQKVSS